MDKTEYFGQMKKKRFLLCGASLLPALVAVGLRAAVLSAAGPAPGWWTDRGVLTTNAANDYAALNTGQLKHLAYMAWLELEALPGGAGFAPAFTNAQNNFAAVTVGQLKETARPFYDRLGLSRSLPWSGSVGSNDFALANIGQALLLFSFEPGCAGDKDQDGMPDQWENVNSLNPSYADDAALDADGDGLSNLDEFLLGADPRCAAGASPSPTLSSLPQLGAGITGLRLLTPSASIR